MDNSCVMTYILRVISRTSLLPLISSAEQRSGRTGVIDSQGTFTYNELLDASSRVAAALLDGRSDLAEERVAFLITPGFPWVAVQWGIWRAGGVAVPLPLNSTRSELEYFIDDTQASALVYDALAETLLTPIAAARGIRAWLSDDALAHLAAELPDVASERRAMILYTSGTTSRPKGVVTTHANIAAQITSLIRGVGVVGRRSHPAVPAAPPRARHHQRGVAARCGRAPPARCCRASMPNVVWERIASGT